MELTECCIAENFAAIGAGTLGGRLKPDAVDLQVFPRIRTIVENLLADLTGKISTINLDI